MEINFDRGGTLPKKKSNLFKTTTFGSRNEEKEKKQKTKCDQKKKSSKKDENGDGTTEIRSANMLTLNTLVPDMILMGIVKSIYADRLLLSLPGRLFCRVPITHISKSYSEFLQSTLEGEDLLDKPKSLSEMFHVGQMVYTKVLDKCHGDKQDILCSLLPEDINSEISSNMLDKGNVILCAIEEVEDHGYFLETGIKGIRGFLPKKNIKSEPKVGEQLFCKVQKVSESVVTFAAFKKGEQIKVETADVPNMKTLLPSTIVNFNVVSSLKNGFEGLLFDGSVTAYANELYVPSKLSTDPKLIGREVKARVLYRMPLSNQLYVTLNVDDTTNDKITFGTVIENAKVIKQTNTGVLFKLNSDHCAFLPRKTIVKNYKNNFDIDTAMLKFSPNSMHTVRIMDYNQFEHCYLCTNNEKLLNEKYYGTYDLNIGQIVQAKIIEKLNDGLRVSIGNVKGFLKGILYHKTAKSNEIGSNIRVRVVEIEHNEKFVQVTNLQGFLRDGCKILDSKKNAKVGETYAGVVLNDKDKHYSVLFFNHILGMVLKNEENQVDIISAGGLKQGSVKMFKIAKVKGDKILLSLAKKLNTQNLGKIYECKVTSVLPTSGLQVFIDDLKAYGKVPTPLLSEFSHLNDQVLAAIKENSKLEVVSLGNNQYSRRDVKYFTNNAANDFNDVKPNDVLRCYVKASNEKIIELECPLKNFNDTIRLNRDAFDNPDDLVLNIGDVVYVNVIAKNESHSNSLYVTPSLPKVWRSNKESLDMLSNYLDDISLLISNAKKLEKPFAKYSIGQRISGTVKNLIGNNVLIELEENVYAQGTAENVHIHKVGSKINEAVIVWIDPIQQMLFVTTFEKCKDEISIDQEVDDKRVCEKKHKAIIVYSNEYLSVCTIRKQGQPLIYVPTKHHYNDFSTSNCRALGNATSKLIIKKLSNGKLLGVFAQDDKVFQKLEKIKNKLEQKAPIKRKLTSSVSESIGEENETIKHPKVVLDDSEDETDKNITKNDENVGENSKEDFQSTLKKQAKHTIRKIGNKIKKKTAQMTKPGKKFLNKDSLLDDDLVNLISYKKIKEGQTSTVIEKKHDKVMIKSTIGKKKKPKRLVKK
ncbi:hypothetical protein ACKWTF_009746 [Chironomus riparius]